MHITVIHFCADILFVYKFSNCTSGNKSVSGLLSMACLGTS
jgi:hypothetical protein